MLPPDDKIILEPLSKEERIQNGKDEKIEKLLDKILPLLVILRMCDEMINKIHANISRDNTIKGLSKSFPSELDQYLSSKYDYVIYITSYSKL